MSELDICITNEPTHVFISRVQNLIYNHYLFELIYQLCSYSKLYSF